MKRSLRRTLLKPIIQGSDFEHKRQPKIWRRHPGITVESEYADHFWYHNNQNIMRGQHESRTLFHMEHLLVNKLVLRYLYLLSKSK